MSRHLAPRVERLEALVGLSLAKTATAPIVGTLKRTVYVDSESLSPAQTGSDEAPYHTISAALTTIGVPTSVADADREILILVSPGTYTENLTIPAYRNLTIEGSHQTVTGSITWANVAGGGAVAPSVSAFLTLRRINLTGDVTITDDATVLSGLLIVDDTTAFEQNVGGNVTTTGAALCNFCGLSSAYVVGNIHGATTVAPHGLFVQLENAEVDGSISCWYIFTLAGTFLYGTSFTTTGFCEFLFDTHFYGVNPQIDGSGTTIVSFDLPSRSSFAEQGGTIVNAAGLVVIDLVNQATGQNTAGALGPAGTVTQPTGNLAQKKSGKVAVSGVISGTAAAAGTVTVNLLRDAGVILSVDVVTGGAANNFHAEPSGFIDTLPGGFGNHTYSIQAVQGTSGVLTVPQNRAYVSALEQ